MLRVRGQRKLAGESPAASPAGRRPMTRAERVIARCLPSAGDIVFVSVLIGMLLGKQGLLLDGDSAWNLRIGSAILDHGLPRTEFLLSTSYGKPEVYWEWLAQVAYAEALRLAGLNGVAALASLLIALTAFSLYAILRQRGMSLLPSLALTYTAVYLTAIGWTARAQLFTLPLLVWWTEWLWRYWRDGDRRRLWAFPAGAMLWVNLHAGVVEGLLELGVAVAVAWLFPRSRGKADPRALTLALAASAAATAVTPWGPGLDAHLLASAANPVISSAINEYQSPNFHDLYALVFLVIAFALVAAWLWNARISTRQGHSPISQPEPLALALAAMWTVLALYSLRFIPTWAVVVTPILAEALIACHVALPGSSPLGDSRLATVWRRLAQRVREDAQRLDATDQMVGRGIWAAMLTACLVGVLLAGGAIPGTRTQMVHAAYNDQMFPVRAAAALKQQGLPPGRGFTTDLWGSYLEYALPAYRPFVDTRQDVESPTLLRDYIAIIDLKPGWSRMLRVYQVQWALLPRQSALAQVLALAPGWQCSPADAMGVARLCLRTG